MLLPGNVTVEVFEPDERLISLITDYYVIENQEMSQDTIPPLGFPVIQFHLKNNVKTFFSNYDFKVDDVVIIGQLSKFARIKQVACSRMIGVNLRPTALYKITNTAASVFTDITTPAGQYLGTGINKLLLDLQQEMPNSERIKSINAFFLPFLEKIDTHQNSRFDKLIDTILLAQGNITIEEIHNLFPVSERTMQRYFSQQTGLGLKAYLRIIRNLNLFRAILEHPELSLLQLIENHGYYDFSHFTRDFKLLTGQSPKAYFTGREEFARILVQL